MNQCFNIQIDDISTSKADILVSPTDNKFSRIIGTNATIYEAAGKEMEKHLDSVGEQPEGTAILTKAYNLKCKKVIHLIGPSEKLSKSEKYKLLQNAYKHAFQLILENGFRSIAISELSDVIYGLQYEEKLIIIVEELKKFIKDNNFSGEINIYCRAKKGLNSFKLFLESDSQIDPYLFDLLKTFRTKQARLTESLSVALSKEEHLNKLLTNANNQIVEQNKEIQDNRKLIAEQYQNLTSSIQYALRIQSAILPPEELLNSSLSEYFIFYKPKDILSGDFYWFGNADSELIIVAADCTGHGVPGALLSMLGMTFINEIVKTKKLTSPCKILDMLREQLHEAFTKSKESDSVKDGMEIAVLAINPEKKKLKYAGAGIGLYLVTNGNIIEYKADKDTIPSFGQSKNFTDHNIDLNGNDNFYIFSDGFPDQFGSLKNKKYGYRRLRSLFEGLYGTPMKEQSSIIKSDFEKWKGDYEQTDDVMLLGFRL
jgi:serine phosphatase RsbU (regulator of sigma subunit)/O-acetyl-ADP-ribose deacetylase (regulator of RNase III)